MTVGRCPSCGAQVAFSAGSARVLVCSHCHTVVADKNGRLEERGKVAALVDTDSPLHLGLTGAYRGTPFRLVGRLQKDWGQGPWDEWYVELDDGRRAWLSESEGAFHFMFPLGRDEGVRLSALAPKTPVPIEGTRFVVEERRSARTVSAEGELPGELTPEGAYADLTGPSGVFATLDFEGAQVGAERYVGHAVTLEELSLSTEGLPKKARQTALAQARCPQCNGPLELKAPDRTMRVGCPYCGALCDVSAGKLSFLKALGKPEHPPAVPLGAKGTLEGVEWLCIGYLRRSCEVDGVRYGWEEYLLFQPKAGFSWLLCSNGHWTLLRPVAAGEVVDHHATARFRGRTYRRFGAVDAVTDYVLGECYWAVEVGERAHAVEWVDPPYSLNADGNGEEITFTHGPYLAPEVVAKAFGLKGLPAPQGIAPSQPNPHTARARTAVTWAAIYSAVVMLLFVVASALAARQLVAQESLEVPAGAAPGSPESMHFLGPFEVEQRGNLGVELSSNVSNDWFGVQGDLVDEATGEVRSFYVEVGYWSGYEGGESWSEGSRRDSAWLSAVPKGRYSLRLAPAFSPSGSPAPRRYEVVVRADVPRFLWAALAILLLWPWPALLFLRARGFEGTRWSDSTEAPSGDD